MTSVPTPETKPRSAGAAMRLLQLAIFALALQASAALAQGHDLVIVTHRDTGLTAASRRDLARLFLGQSREIDGKKLKAVNLADASARMDVAQKLSRKSAAEIDEHFVKLELRGEGKGPPLVANAAELVRLIGEAHNTVGYLSQSDFEGLPSPARESLVTVVIDGKKPGEEGYLLHR